MFTKNVLRTGKKVSSGEGTLTNDDTGWGVGFVRVANFRRQAGWGGQTSLGGRSAGWGARGRVVTRQAGVGGAEYPTASVFGI